MVDDEDTTTIEGAQRLLDKATDAYAKAMKNQYMVCLILTIKITAAASFASLVYRSGYKSGLRDANERMDGLEELTDRVAGRLMESSHGDVAQRLLADRSLAHQVRRELSEA